MLKKTILLLIVLNCFLYAVPTWMYIGTYAITDGPTPWTHLGYAQDAADAFFTAAENNYPNGPAPYRHVNLTDKNVTLSSVSPNSEREICDFLYITSHGYKRGHTVWNSGGTYTESWPTSIMSFGTNYVRWVYLSGCHTLIYDNFNDFFYGTNSWDPAFEGVQCVLGYYSVGYIPWCAEIQAEKFWELWTSPNNPMSIWDSHRESTREGLYVNGYDIAPALVTSRDETGHFFWDDTYQQATSTRGVSWATGTTWMFYGNPL